MTRFLTLCVLFCTLILPAQGALFFDRASDSLELVDLYNSTEGESWLDSWNLEQPMDTWDGVTLNDSGDVVALSLTANNLNGTIPNLNLPELLTLSLNGNRLKGNIPSLNRLRKLTFLDLSSNELDGQIPDFQFPDLNSLRLHDNAFSGLIPDFSGLGRLGSLLLNDNQLNGEIPNFTQLSSLFVLRLSGNNLEGILPDFDRMPQLLILDVSGNQLVGGVPALGFLGQLAVLNVANNDLTGFVPEFNRLDVLERLDISGNRFSGPSPRFTALSNLRELNISNNEIDGPLPDLQVNTSLTVFNASGNSFDGEIPTYNALEDLQILDLSNNELTDTLPDLSHLSRLSELHVDSNFLVHSNLDLATAPQIRVVSAEFNYFTFSDLDDLNGSGLGALFAYAPQRRIIMPDTIYATIRDDVIFDLDIDDGIANSRYNWYKDEVFLQALELNRLVLININALDVGTYYAIVRNDAWPALSLFSEEVFLSMDCPFNVVEIVDSICFGDTLVVNGKSYFETGTYTDTAVVNDPAICDSVFNIDLTILPVYDTLVMDTICESDQVNFAGQIITESGSYRDTLQTTNGCDSIVQLDLMVFPSFERLRIDTICAGDTLYVGPFVHTTTDVYRDTLQTVNGCDSVIFTDLTVLDTFLSVTTVSLCKGESYEFRGQTYTQSGVYVDASTNRFGCDSSFVLDLYIQPTDTFFFQQTICAGDSMMLGDSVIRADGLYTASFTTANGCDSIVVLDLLVIDRYQITVDTFYCPGDTLFFGMDTITRVGIYIDTLMARGGCDSIVRWRVEEQLFIPKPEVEATLCFGDSLIVGNTIYKVSGRFFDTIPGVGNCDTIFNVLITVADPITLDGVQLRIRNNNLGSITPTISGGIGTLSYLWSNGSTEPALDSIPAGTYTVTVTDANGCFEVFEFTLDPTTSTDQLRVLQADVQLYPNPVHSQQELLVDIDPRQSGTYEAVVFDVLGREIKRFSWRLSPGRSTQRLDLTLDSGVYYLRVADQQGAFLVRHFVVQ